MELNISDYSKEILRQYEPTMKQRKAQIDAEVEKQSSQSEESREKLKLFNEATKQEGTIEWHINQLHDLVGVYANLLEVDTLGARIPSQDIASLRDACISMMQSLKDKQVALVAAQPILHNGTSSQEMIEFAYVSTEFMISGAEILHRPSTTTTTN